MHCSEENIDGIEATITAMYKHTEYIGINDAIIRHVYDLYVGLLHLSNDFEEKFSGEWSMPKRFSRYLPIRVKVRQALYTRVKDLINRTEILLKRLNYRRKDAGQNTTALA